MLIAIATWILFGFFVGLLARALFPGTQSLGLVGTSALGILGAFVGGFLTSLVVGYPILEFHPAGLLGSILGAMLVLGLANLASRSSAV